MSYAYSTMADFFKKTSSFRALVPAEHFPVVLLRILINCFIVELKALKRENDHLKSKLRLRENQLFGRKTEKAPSRTGRDEVEDVPADSGSDASGSEKKKKKRKRGAQKGHKGSGRKIPKNLPVDEVLHALPADEQYCDICHLPFIATAKTESSWEVDVKIEYRLKKHIRRIYQKSCSCTNASYVLAPAPPKIIPKGKYTIAFWSKVLFDKYVMHVPFHRQVLQMKSFNLPISKGTLLGGVKYLAQFFEPLYEAFRQESQKARLQHADETRWKMFFKVEGKKNFLWWLWVFVSEKVIFYVVDKTRSAAVPKAHFASSLARFLMADRYSAYKTLSLALAFCWAHVRRDFTNLLIRHPHKKPLCEWAQQWIKWIGQLYAINEHRLVSRGDHTLFSKYQNELEEAILALEKKFTEEYAYPEQRKIIKSLKKHWQGLILFVAYPQIPMDNNISERALRSPVVGRKNAYGNHSEAGGLLSAMMYTFTQTCLLHGLRPQAYLAYYLKECARTGKAPENIERFLPHRLQKEGPEELLIKE